MAEQLAVQHSLGEGGAVDADERTSMPLAAQVDEARDYCLTGTRLPLDQNSGFTQGDRFQLHKQFLHSGIAGLQQGRGLLDGPRWPFLRIAPVPRLHELCPVVDLRGGVRHDFSWLRFQVIVAVSALSAAVCKGRAFLPTPTDLLRPRCSILLKNKGFSTQERKTGITGAILLHRPAHVVAVLARQITATCDFYFQSLALVRAPWSKTDFSCPESKKVARPVN